MKITQLSKLVVGTVTLAMASGMAFAQQASNYPDKPIRWVVPYTPGGFTDNVARMVTGKLSEVLGQTIVVENKPGANSIIGVETVSKAAPDGYTIVTILPAHTANLTLYKERLSDPLIQNMVPVSLAGLSPLILTTTKSLPVKTTAELIDYAKKNPGKLSFGSSGVGSSAHLTTELLKHTAGIDMVHIPYKGTAPALADLIGGNIQVLVDVPISMLPQVKGDKVNALGMFAAKRLEAAPGIPTLPESGGPAIEAASWVMFMAPAGTPPEIVQKLSDGVAKVLQDPEIKARFAELSVIPGGESPAATKKFFDNEAQKWEKVITTAGVKAE